MGLGMIPAQSVGFFEYCDLVALGLLLPALCWLILHEYRRGGELLHTISHTVTASKKSAMIYGSVMTVVVPLYYGALYFWVSPKAGLPHWMYWQLIVAFVCEMIFVWFSPWGKWGVVHTVTAGFMFVATYIMLAMLAFSGAVSEFARSLLWLSLVLGIVAAIVIAAKKKQWLFWAELSYCIAFWLAVSTVAHT